MYQKRGVIKAQSTKTAKKIGPGKPVLPAGPKIPTQPGPKKPKPRAVVSTPSKIHPALLNQLENSKELFIQAVVQIRLVNQPNKLLSHAEMLTLANTIFARVTLEVGYDARRKNILRNIGVIVVEADVPFLKALIRQPEIISAIPNVS